MFRPRRSSAHRNDTRREPEITLPNDADELEDFLVDSSSTIPLSERRSSTVSATLTSASEDAGTYSGLYGHHLSRRRQRTSRRIRPQRWLTLIVLVFFVNAFLIHYFLLHEYAWVHRRCTKARFWAVFSTLLLSWYSSANTRVQVECVEARTHELAMKDDTLIWSGSFNPDWKPNVWRQVLNSSAINDRTPVTRHVHYTFTAPIQGQKLDLAVCSIEAMSRQCRKQSHLYSSIDPCTIHVWVVDQAAVAYRTATTKTVVDSRNEMYELDWYNRVKAVLETEQTSPQHTARAPFCIHVSFPDETGPDLVYGSDCPNPVLDENPGSCPIVLEHTRKLRAWLKSPLAANQLPAHQSDAWRLLALAEYGGLYLDTDVVPLLPPASRDESRSESSNISNILFLPETTIPTQNKPGAYRMNGGVLRMEIPTSSCRGTIMDALLRDHLKWAPRLARQPLKEQSFGFLGPCALTRVYTSRRDFRQQTTVLSYKSVEGGTFCRSATVGSDQVVALHLSGGRKASWLLDWQTDTCAKETIQSMCPTTFQSLQFGKAPDSP